MARRFARISEDAPPPEIRTRFGPPRAEVRAFVELLAATGFAFAQPALDALGRNASVFVERGASFADALALTLTILCVPAIAGYAIEVAIGAIFPRLRDVSHAVLVGGCVAIVVATTTRDALGPVLRSVVAVGVLIGVATVLVRFATSRRFVRYSVVGPPLFAAMFLFASSATPVFLGSQAGSPASDIARPNRVVMVVFDELPLESLLGRAGNLDADLFPNFARLAGSSTWFRNTTTVAPYTEVAVPVLLSGKEPDDSEAVPALSQYPDNLFTLLGDGYDMNVHEVATGLCPGACGNVRSGGLTDLLGVAADLWTDRIVAPDDDIGLGQTRATREVKVTTRRFLRSIRPVSEPRLDFAHIMLPHEPFHYLGDFQDTLAPVKMPGAAYLRWTDSPGVEIARRRHLLQLQTADHVLGELIDRLVEIDAFDDALVVVTADHGISFTPGEPLRSASEANYHEIMWTPLFVKSPGQTAGEVDDRAALSTDVLPTILDVLDASTDVAFDGRSLFGEPRAATEARRLYQTGRTAFEPADVLKPNDGRDYLEFDGAEGFERVLANSGLPPEGDPALRIFRIGRFGGLVGQPSTGLLVDGSSAHAASIREPDRFASVDPTAAEVPWVYVEAFFNGPAGPQTLALLDQGVVIAVGEVSKLDDGGHGFVTFLVPPALMVSGNHRLTVAIVGGTPVSPTLAPVLTG